MAAEPSTKSGKSTEPKTAPENKPDPADPKTTILGRISAAKSDWQTAHAKKAYAEAALADDLIAFAKELPRGSAAPTVVLDGVKYRAQKGRNGNASSLVPVREVGESL